MKPWLIGGGAFLIFIVIMFGCMAVNASRGDVQDQTNVLKTQTVPTRQVVVGTTIPGSQAQWKGVPLGRPSWCVAPASWTMANLPSNRGLVPACESQQVIGYLGYYQLTELGCTPIVGIGAKVVPNGILTEPNGLPSYGAYTVCAKTIPGTPVPTPR